MTALRCVTGARLPGHLRLEPQTVWHRDLSRFSGARRPSSKVCGRSKGSDSESRAQELQTKARLLRQQQEELAQQLQQLNAEAESLTESGQKLVQAELHSQENTQVELNNIPEQIKELLASAGVLNSVPWDASAPSNGESNAYFQTPEDSQSYDWDLSMDTLDDVIEVEQPTSDGSQGNLDSEESDSADEDEEEEWDDEAGFSEDDNTDFEPGYGVEDMLRTLEEGGALPDIEGLMEAEDPHEFQKRIQKLVDRYEAQFLKKKDRKITTEEIREMEREEAWEPTTRIPILDEDILEVRPAPALPADIQQQYDAMQQCLYLLRRAHLIPQPDEPVKALASTRLVDMEELRFEDPLIASVGLGPWLQYMEGLKRAGAWTQVEHIWAEVSDDRPTPVYKILVDQFLNIPFPRWFYTYLADNADEESWQTESGGLQVPALLAVHHSAPDDPSIPLQRAYTDTQTPIAPKPFASRSPKQPKPPAEATSATGADANADVDDAVTAEAAGASAGKGVENSRRKPKCVRLAGLRRMQEQVLEDDEVQSVLQQYASSASDATIAPAWEAGDKVLPRLLYMQEDVLEELSDTGDSELLHKLQEQDTGGKQQPPAEQHRQQDNEKSSVVAESSVVVTDASQSSGPPPNEESKSSTDKDGDLQRGQHSEATQAHMFGAAGEQSSSSSDNLPGIDLLAQFGEAETDPAPDQGSSARLTDANVNAVEEDTVQSDAPPQASDNVKEQGHEPSDQTSSGTINLEGAQVLTPEGWQPISNQSEPGTAWEQGKCTTIGMTLQYEMCAASGKIVAVTCGWATIDAFAWTVQDVLDMYIKCTSLHNM